MHKAGLFLKRAIAVLAPLLLIGLGLAHVFLHDRVALDWPTVTLLIVGIGLILLPVQDVAAKLLKLKIGGVEIEMMQAALQLAQKVGDAENETPIVIEPSDVSPRAELPAGVLAEEASNASEPKPQEPNTIIHAIDSFVAQGVEHVQRLGNYFRVKGDVERHRGSDPEVALYLLGREIDNRLKVIAAERVPDLSPEAPLRHVLSVLVSRGLITRSLSVAVDKMWDLKEALLHSASTPASREAADVGIQEGLRILLMLTAVRGPNE